MTEDERERACAAVTTPASIAEAVTGYRWVRDMVGESGGSVYRLHDHPGRPDLYLKHGVGTVADDVTDEMTRLRWLGDYLPVPAVLRFVRTDDEAWLLMSAMRGRTAYRVLAAEPENRLAVVDALAAFLLRLHAIPVGDCPFNADHVFRLARGRTRIDAGLVDIDDFDADRAGWSAEQVWTALQATPIAAERVVTHGDFSLDNLLIADGAVVGCIDVGRVGIADRYQDLAILGHCLGEFDASLQARLFERYGIAAPDPARLTFHLMLDELF